MLNHKSISKDLMRRMNRSLVLEKIRLEGPIARAQIARESGLSAPTISGFVAALIREDLVFEREEGESSGGRRPVLLSLNPTAGFAIGISIREDRLVGALVNLMAKVTDIREMPFASAEPQNGVEAIERLVEQLLEENQIEAPKLLGVGLGLPVVVSRETGRIVSMPIFDWEKDMPFEALVRKTLGVPVRLESEIHCLTIAEKWFGIARALKHFIAIQIGPQIGMGAIVNGRPYYGRGGAGEFAHTVVDPDGAPCECGKRGCLATLVADPYLVDQAGKFPALADRVESLRDLWSLAADGQPDAMAILQQAGSHLGRAIANLINLFDPQLILLTGKGVRLWGVFREAIFEAVDSYTWNDREAAAVLQIRELETPDRAWAAAGLVLQTVFDSPIYQPDPDPSD